jgi:hypothetical protein
MFLIAPVEHTNENLRPDKPGLSRIMQFGSGRFVVKDGMVTVTASDGRTTKGVIEDSMLSPERIAKTVPLQLHRMGKRSVRQEHCGQRRQRAGTANPLASDRLAGPLD